MQKPNQFIRTPQEGDINKVDFFFEGGVSNLPYPKTQETFSVDWE